MPPPLRMTLPPPSMTIFGLLSLNTLAGLARMMVAGSGPQLNVMIPPAATAAMNASGVQLSCVPVPTTVVGLDTSSSCASLGIGHVPSGLPGSPGWIGTTVPPLTPPEPLSLTPPEPLSLTPPEPLSLPAEPHALKSAAAPMAHAHTLETSNQLFAEPRLSIMHSPSRY